MTPLQTLDHPNFSGGHNSITASHAYRVLIIGDEPLLAMMLADSLSAAGYQIRIAASKEESLHLLATQNVDLILLDLCPAKVDNYRFCDELHQRYSKPILAMSGCSTTENMLEAFAAGACGFIQKPFTLHTLESQLKQACKLLL